MQTNLSGIGTPGRPRPRIKEPFLRSLPPSPAPFPSPVRLFPPPSRRRALRGPENHLGDTASGRAGSRERQRERERERTGPARAGSFLLSCCWNPVIVVAISQTSDSDLSSRRARGMPRIKPFSGATGHTRCPSTSRLLHAPLLARRRR